MGQVATSVVILSGTFVAALAGAGALADSVVASPANGAAVSGYVTINVPAGGYDAGGCTGASTSVEVVNSAGSEVAWWTRSNLDGAAGPVYTPLDESWLSNTVPNGQYVIAETSENARPGSTGKCMTVGGMAGAVHVTVANGPKPYVGSSGATPARPVRCPVSPDTANASTGDLLTPTAEGIVPWPPAPPGIDPESYGSYLHEPATSPPVRPQNWESNAWKLTSAQAGDTSTSRAEPAGIDQNPQELCGVMGMSVDQAWQTTTGRPDTVIASIDSGVEECSQSIVNKLYLNRGALPYPENAAGLAKPQLAAQGQSFADQDPYDLDGSGVLDAAQYASDPRVAAVAAAYGGLFCARTARSGSDFVSPEDLILTFGTPTLPGGRANPYYYPSCGASACSPTYPGQVPAGFTEAISGWDFVDNTNNPYDVVHYDHGTGEAKDMAGAADSTTGSVGTCPSCMVMPIRAGDSFMTTGNWFAEGVLFAVDSGATLVSSAEGGFDVTPTDRQAIAYAGSHGVPILASAADEESQHHNLPGVLSHLIVVNSITAPPQVTTNGLATYNPGSYLYLNGCTNYGTNIAVSVESQACSSEATGKVAGISGLAKSAAADAAEKGVIEAYPGLTSVSGQPVALSANELKQLVTMSANPVDFADAAGPQPPVTASGSGPATTADNYGVSVKLPLGLQVPVTTSRYPSTAGFNQYFGYGRVNAANLVERIAAGDIPPEASISSPSWFSTLDPDVAGATLAVSGRVAAVRSSSYQWEVLVGAGVSPLPNAWRLVASGKGAGGPAGAYSGMLAHVPLSTIASVFPKSTNFSAPPTLPNGQPKPNVGAFTLLVQVKDARGLVGMARRTDFLHHDASLLAGSPQRLDSSVVGSPKLVPIGPGGVNALVVAQSDGTVDAFQPDGSELPGWPVETQAIGAHTAEGAFTSGAVTADPHCEILGNPAAGDLLGNGSTDVVATDVCGNVYAWTSAGQLLAGFPVHSDPAYCGPAVANPDNRVLCGFFAGPALGDLMGNGQLDIAAASMDRHVYAWQPDGTAVPGWPVLVVDPSKVASVDPVTNQVTFEKDAGQQQGTKLITTPAIGRLQGGDGPPDVIVGSNEGYSETPNTASSDPACILGECLLSPGNSRVYVISPQGTGAASNCSISAAGAATAQPDACAFLTGWPVAIADWAMATLPDVGDGTTASPALADLSGNGKLEVGVSADIGPAYVLKPDGTSYLGTSGGKPVTATTKPYGTVDQDGDADDAGGWSGHDTDGDAKVVNGSDALCWGQPGGAGLGRSIPALGSPVFAPLANSKAPGISLIEPALSFCKALDSGLPARQTPAEAQLDAWDVSGGGRALQYAFPRVMNDMEFFDQPVVAYLGAGGPYVITGSSVYDLRAVDGAGAEAPGFPKFTGGWMVGSAAVGDFGAEQDQVIVAGTREGRLFVWGTGRPAGEASGPWPMGGHDLANTGNLETPLPANRVSAPPAGTAQPGTEQPGTEQPGTEQPGGSVVALPAPGAAEHAATSPTARALPGPNAVSSVNSRHAGKGGTSGGHARAAFRPGRSPHGSGGGLPGWVWWIISVAVAMLAGGALLFATRSRRLRRA